VPVKPADRRGKPAVDNAPEIWSHVDNNAPALIALSDRVWGIPETCYKEVKSVAEHVEELKRQGFRVTENVADIPTAVVGEAGEGGPVIAFLGEYDALPDLSQEAGVAEPRPIERGGNGHGCGHNMLGSAAMLAAVAVRDWLKATGTAGRVRYYGCPAEEGGAAKTFMVRAGAFDDVDIAITWHPHAIADVAVADSLANARIDFVFKGKAAHAAASPHLGRSALDAVELMNVGVNYLREHVPTDSRIHYALIDAGGIAPNVVQANATVRYLIRSPELPTLMPLIERVKKVAQGAAMMTETTVEAHTLSAVANCLPNEPLEKAMRRHLEVLGAPQFDDEDRAFARAIQATYGPEEVMHSLAMFSMEEVMKGPLCDQLVPEDAARTGIAGSTDVGDVSWVVPTVQMWGATYAIGTPFHTWQMVAQGKSPAAHKGMVHASKVMAALGKQAFEDPELVAAAQEDLRLRTGKTPYVCPLPDEARPPLEM
jgi:aminobenzoyl-glutamate utilization protein B